jgi:hypothetical protein
MTFHVPEQFRVKKGELGSTQEYGNNGAFLIRSVKLPRVVTTIASDGMGFEHVSVSVFDRCPNWLEMCFIKDLFWDEDDCVMQLHVPKSDWVNCHPFTLHLWKPIGMEIPRPLKVMV